MVRTLYLKPIRIRLQNNRNACSMYLPDFFKFKKKEDANDKIISGLTKRI